MSTADPHRPRGYYAPSEGTIAALSGLGSASFLIREMTSLRTASLIWPGPGPAGIAIALTFRPSVQRDNNWWRRRDLNTRSLAHEASELPDYSTPHR